MVKGDVDVIQRIIERAEESYGGTCDKILRNRLVTALKSLIDILEYLDYSKEIHTYVPEDDQKAIFTEIFGTAMHELYSQRMVVLSPSDERNHTGVEALFEYIEGYENEPNAHVNIVSSEYSTVEEYKFLKAVYESCIKEVSR